MGSAALPGTALLSSPLFSSCSADAQSLAVGCLVLASQLAAPAPPAPAAAAGMLGGGAAAHAAVAVTRLALLPAATLCAAVAAKRTFASADPLLLFFLCVQACQPPAQNLVLLLSLSPATASSAPSAARFLLRQYAVAALPAAAWVALAARLVLHA